MRVFSSVIRKKKHIFDFYYILETSILEKSLVKKEHDLVGHRVKSKELSKTCGKGEGLQGIGGRS